MNRLSAVPSDVVLRGLLRVGGVIATGAGVHTAVTGGRSVPGYSALDDPRLESELRFYGAFYAAYGVAVWRTAATADRDASAVRTAASVLFAAGVARATGWWLAGKPSRHQIALLAVELAAPPILVALQTRSARG